MLCDAIHILRKIPCNRRQTAVPSLPGEAQFASPTHHESIPTLRITSVCRPAPVALQWKSVSIGDDWRFP